METKSIIYNDSYFVTQANKLILAKQDALSINGFRLIRLALAQIAMNDDELFTYSISVSELAEYWGITPDNIYREINETGNSLARKAVYIETGTRDRKGNKNYTLIPWLSNFTYCNGVVTIGINRQLKDYVLGLNKLFTSYQMAFLKKIDSSYAARLFEILFSFSYRQFTDKPIVTEMYGYPVKDNEIIFLIEDLEDYLGCKGKYSRTRDFIKWAIMPACETITRNALFPVSCEPIRKGHSYQYIKFTFESMQRIAELANSNPGESDK